MQTCAHAHQQDIVKDPGHVNRRRFAAAENRSPCTAGSRRRCFLLLLLQLCIQSPLQGSPGVLHHAGMVVRLNAVCIAKPAPHTADAPARLPLAPPP